jgi:hypothetical protein
MSKVLNRRVDLLEGKGSIFPVTASLTLTVAKHLGDIITLKSATGLTVTLPAATGTGYSYTIVADTSVTSNGYIIKVANSTDIMGGVATMGSSGGTSASVGTATTSDTITMNGTTTGGLRGSKIELTDVAAGLWQVSVYGVCSGIAATPFSATV